MVIAKAESNNYLRGQEGQFILVSVATRGALSTQSGIKTRWRIWRKSWHIQMVWEVRAGSGKKIRENLFLSKEAGGVLSYINRLRL